MAGKNPYLEEQDIQKPKQSYTLSFPAIPKSIQVEPEKLPYSDTGIEGSILEIALGHGIEIDHSCGGVLACSTCHIFVKKGLNTCNEATEAELDQLEQAPNSSFHSRLACHCVPNGSSPVEIEIPAWNRNLVKEGH